MAAMSSAAAQPLEPIPEDQPAEAVRAARASRPDQPVRAVRAEGGRSGRPLRVLYIVHNHPALHPGGAEAYALELYEAMRDRPDVEPVLLARIGSNVAR